MNLTMTLLHCLKGIFKKIIHRAGIYSLITNRIGLGVFISRLERLKDSKELSSAHPSFGVVHGKVMKEAIFFDLYFSEFFKSVFSAITKPIINHGQEPLKSEKSEKDEQLRKKIVELETLILTLRGAHSQESSKLKSKITELDDLVVTLKTQNKELESTVTRYKDQLSTIERDQEDLFICLADQDQEINNLKEELSKK
jgi:hypothetical protein